MHRDPSAPGYEARPPVEPDPRRGPEHVFEEGDETPPPGARTMAVVRWLLLVAVIAAAVFSIYGYLAPSFGHAAPGTEKDAQRYFCPMHPQITSDHPGECPICHMSLEPMPAREAPPQTPPKAPPQAPRQAPTQVPSAGASSPPGTTPVTLALDRVQAIGVRTALVERRGSAGPLRVTATVEVPEQGRAEVHVRAPGYVESIRVRDLGVKVKAGETLASVYSPEVLQAEQELITIGGWGASGTAGAPAPPLAAARRKLELLGLDKGTIDRVVSTGQPVRAVHLASPTSGYVVVKNVVLGSYVMPDKVLFEIADLGRVYVVASVYASQLGGVHVGDAATFSTPSLPGRTFATKVDLVHPDVDLATRAGRVRLSIDNGDLALRPGQFGTLELVGKAAEALTLPMDAIIDTGRSVYVFVAEEGGRFVPRVVELGEQSGDRFVVLRGLEEGQRVVSGATFLIDAESRLQSSLGESAPGR